MRARGTSLALTLALLFSAFSASPARADEVRVAPNAHGVLDAWLVTGPAASKPPVRAKPEAHAIVGGNDGVIELRGALGAKDTEATASLAGVLTLDRDFSGALLLGASDGLRVLVD